MHAKDLMKQLRIPTAAVTRLDHDLISRISYSKPSSMGGKRESWSRKGSSGDIEIDEAERFIFDQSKKTDL